jgi:hypothetical protein
MKNVYVDRLKYQCGYRIYGRGYQILLLLKNCLLRYGTNIMTTKNVYASRLQLLVYVNTMFMFYLISMFMKINILHVIIMFK